MGGDYNGVLWLRMLLRRQLRGLVSQSAQDGASPEVPVIYAELERDYTLEEMPEVTGPIDETGEEST